MKEWKQTTDERDKTVHHSHTESDQIYLLKNKKKCKRQATNNNQMISQMIHEISPLPYSLKSWQYNRFRS